MGKIAELLYRIIRPFIVIEWHKSFETYGTIFEIRVFGNKVSEVIYSPYLGGLREKWVRSD